MSVVPVSLVLFKMKKSLCELKGNLEMLEGSLIMYRLGPGYVVESWTPVDREREKIIIGISENLDIAFSRGFLTWRTVILQRKVAIKR